MDYNDLSQTPSTIAVFTPICALCKKVRNADGSWSAPSSQTYEHVTHVFCKECADMILAIYSGTSNDNVLFFPLSEGTPVGFKRAVQALPNMF